MYFYQAKQNSEVNEVRDWIVDQNGGPKKYFDTNPCIKKWWHDSDKPSTKKQLSDEELELWGIPK